MAGRGALICVPGGRKWWHDRPRIRGLSPCPRVARDLAQAYGHCPGSVFVSPDLGECVAAIGCATPGERASTRCWHYQSPLTRGISTARRRAIGLGKPELARVPARGRHMCQALPGARHTAGASRVPGARSGPWACPWSRRSSLAMVTPCCLVNDLVAYASKHPEVAGSDRSGWRGRSNMATAHNNHADAWSVSTTAKRTGRDSSTIRRYLRSGRFPDAYRGDEPGRPWWIPVGNVISASLLPSLDVDTPNQTSGRTCTSVAGDVHELQLDVARAEATIRAQEAHLADLRAVMAEMTALVRSRPCETRP